MMPDRRRRPKARPQEILAAALELFSSQGFSATRLEDVAAKAGLSKAAIYLYFPDKMALLRKLIEETAGENLEPVEILVRSDTGPVAPILRQLLRYFATRIASSPLPYLMKLVISEARAQPELGQLYLEKVVSRGTSAMQALIERGIASGEFRPVDAFLTVRCVIGPMLLAGIWRGVFEPIGGEPLDIEALAAQHADILIEGLRAHAPASPREAA